MSQPQPEKDHSVLTYAMVAIAGVVIINLIIALVGAVRADGATDPIPGALQRVGDGTYTARDLELLRNSDVANQVLDPEQPVAVTVRTGQTAQRVLGSCGHWVEVWYRKKSLLGRTIYKWHHRVVFCRTSKKITKWQNRYDYVTNASSVVEVKELTVNEKGGIGDSSAWSQRQRHIQLCIVKYGCYANLYPWSKITVYASGSYKYTGDND